jgi:hypothetical protein
MAIINIQNNTNNVFILTYYSLAFTTLMAIINIQYNENSFSYTVSIKEIIQTIFVLTICWLYEPRHAGHVEWILGLRNAYRIVIRKPDRRQH